MLLAFRVANFRSIRDEQELSLLVPTSVRNSEEMRTTREAGWDTGVSTVAGIYGANASGKSNVLAALGAMRSVILEPALEQLFLTDTLSVEPFKLNRSSVRQPTELDIELQLDSVRHQYGFRMLEGRVTGEWLYAWPHGRRQTWFERDSPSGQDDYYFGKRFSGQNQAIANLTRPDRLFITVAHEHNHPQVIKLVTWFRDRVDLVLDRSIGRVGAAARFSSPSAISESDRLVELLKLADLGISGVRLVKRPRELWELFDRLFRDDRIDSFGGTPHPEYEVQFMHAVAEDEPIAFPMTSESHGTKVWFDLARRALHALDKGGLLLIDELDTSLHPRLVAELVRIFRDPSVNTRQAQLVFNAHDTNLLGNLLGKAALRRDQVWLTEKDEHGATQLYSLSDFKPRKHENLERGYLQGRYGAVPYVDASELSLVGGERDE